MLALTIKTQGQLVALKIKTLVEVLKAYYFFK